MTSYDVGDSPDISTTVLVANTPTDATMSILRTAPDNTVDSPAIVHTGLGAYKVNASLTMPGNWLYHWTASGAAIGVDEYQIYVQPPGFRIISVQDAKRHINKTMTYTGDDNELRDFISVAGELCDKLAGPTVNRTVVEYYSGPAVEIFLRQWPVVSVTSVVESWPGGPNYNVTQETDLGVGPSTGYDFTFDQQVGSITRRVNAWTYAFPPGRNNIKVTYVVGRFGGLVDRGRRR